jgi:hypothetical protein
MDRFTEDPGVAEFERYMRHVDTNNAVVSALLDDCMAPASYVGTMKVLSLRLNQEDADEDA